MIAQASEPEQAAHLLGEQVAQALLQAVVLVLAPPHLVLPLHVPPLQVRDRARGLLPLRAQLRRLRLGRRLLQPRLQQWGQGFLQQASTARGGACQQGAATPTATLRHVAHVLAPERLCKGCKTV